MTMFFLSGDIGTTEVQFQTGLRVDCIKGERIRRSFDARYVTNTFGSCARPLVGCLKLV